MTKKLFLTLISAVFLVFMLAGCGTKESTNENTDNDSAENQKTTDEDMRNAETSDIEETDADFENLNDSDVTKTAEEEFEEYVAEFCESLDLPEGSSESCPSVVDYDSYWVHAGGGENELEMTIDNVEFYDNRPEFSHSFGVVVSGTCENESAKCSVEIEHVIPDSIEKESLIGKKWYLKSAEIVTSHNVVRGAWPETWAEIATDENGDLVAVSAQAVYGHKIGEKLTVKERPEFDIEVYIPEDCKIYCSSSRDCGGKSFIDVKMWPPLKFTRNGKSIIVRNWESLEMDDYVYSVRTSTAAHEKDPDQAVSDSGRKYYFDFSVFNKKAFGFE
ncbi:hypothetical protein J5834_06850 [bacterium]|nr:hypothetical protein [bacterium]